jgi:hypothetical protein
MNVPFVRFVRRRQRRLVVLRNGLARWLGSGWANRVEPGRQIRTASHIVHKRARAAIMISVSSPEVTTQEHAAESDTSNNDLLQEFEKSWPQSLKFLEDRLQRVAEKLGGRQIS